MKNSLIILTFFAFGLILGIYKYIPIILIENDISIYILYALMFFVGISIGSDKESLKILRTANIKIFLIPISVIIGSLLGSALISIFINDISAKESMAVGAGFGYYSLSSILITEIYDETLGTIALLSNIMRESFTLVATPFLVKYFGKLAGIASGGATSMDTTLPIIVKYSGKEWAIISVFSGIILTLLVPFLVPLILKVF